ncbi:hypothetical protein THAOC_37122, partial [Thalassiosira oceanica]
MGDSDGASRRVAGAVGGGHFLKIIDGAATHAQLDTLRYSARASRRSSCDYVVITPTATATYGDSDADTVANGITNIVAALASSPNQSSVCCLTLLVGGEAAKERRRLKRLQKQQSDGDAASAVNPGPESPKKRTDDESGKTLKTLGSDAALLRLRRKMERKSSGKFKAQSVSKPAIPPSNNKKRDARTKNNDNTQWKRRRENEKHDDGRNGRHKGDNNSNWRSRDNTRGGKPREKPYKKKTITKQKVQKPKHLKRKLGQLSKAMSEPAEGNSLADLEGQMKDLIQKMEEYKKLKQTRGDRKDSADTRAESKQDDVTAEAGNKQ